VRIVSRHTSVTNAEFSSESDQRPRSVHGLNSGALRKLRAVEVATVGGGQPAGA
jgi:stage V sporulation protein SpoVS